MNFMLPNTARTASITLKMCSIGYPPLLGCYAITPSDLGRCGRLASLTRLLLSSFRLLDLCWCWCCCWLRGGYWLWGSLPTDDLFAGEYLKVVLTDVFKNTVSI